MNPQIRTSVTDLLQSKETVKLAMVYGSVAENNEMPDSDFDLAVAGEKSLSPSQKKEHIEELALITGRPIDLIDLRETHRTLLKQVLTKGTLILKKRFTLYANIIKRMLFNQADFLPYYNRILKERGDKWIEKRTPAVVRTGADNAD